MNYGVALLEIEDDINAQENELEENDIHIGDYFECTINKVPASKIKYIYIPRIFKGRKELEDLNTEVKQKIKYVNIEVYKFTREEYDLLYKKHYEYSSGKIKEADTRYRRVRDDELERLKNVKINTKNEQYLRKEVIKWHSTRLNI